MGKRGGTRHHCRCCRFDLQSRQLKQWVQVSCITPPSSSCDCTKVSRSAQVVSGGVKCGYSPRFHDARPVWKSRPKIPLLSVLLHIPVLQRKPPLSCLQWRQRANSGLRHLPRTSARCRLVTAHGRGVNNVVALQFVTNVNMFFLPSKLITCPYDIVDNTFPQLLYGHIKYISQRRLCLKRTKFSDRLYPRKKAHEITRNLIILLRRICNLSLVSTQLKVMPRFPFFVQCHSFNNFFINLQFTYTNLHQI